MDAGFPYMVAAYVLVVAVLFAYMIVLDVRQRRVRNEVKRLEHSLPGENHESNQ